MASSSHASLSATQVVTVPVETSTRRGATQQCTLVLRKPKTDKKIKWSEKTVDNENMGKKKSKCCCIYEKPKMFNESSSESESSGDETDHCKGHKGKCYKHSGGTGGSKS